MCWNCLSYIKPVTDEGYLHQWMNVNLVEKHSGLPGSAPAEKKTCKWLACRCNPVFCNKLHFNLTSHKAFQPPWKHFGPPPSGALACGDDPCSLICLMPKSCRIAITVWHFAQPSTWAQTTATMSTVYNPVSQWHWWTNPCLMRRRNQVRFR